MVSRTLIRRVSDAFLVITLAILVGILTVKVRPVRRGFFCDDDSIRYPYKDNTVTGTMLLIGVAILPHVFMFVIEILATCSRRSQKLKLIQLDLLTKQELADKQDTVESSSPDKQQLTNQTARHTCMSALGHTATLCWLFWFGLIFTTFVTQVGKISIGRLRPYFYDVCKPTNFTCTDGYVTDYVCSSYNYRMIHQARQSFPSGHSSMSVFVALFLVLHIQRRLPVYPRIGFLVKAFLQSLLAVLAFYTCLSRVTDNWHHSGDVVVGALIGAAIAVWVMIYHDKQSSYNKTLAEEESKSNQSVTEDV